MTKHRRFTPEFKAKVMLEIINGQKSAADICQEHSLKLERFPNHFIAW